MNELLDKYFLDGLSTSEKQELFNQLENDQELMKEFVRRQNLVALSGLIYCKGDDAWSAAQFLELKRQLGKQARLRFFIQSLKYVATASIVALLTWGAFTEYNSFNQRNLFTVVEVPKGQRVHLTFEDGSDVWLGSRSKIKFPAKFNDKTRSVELNGEGLFSVTKDKDKPFIVHTGKYDVKVLGTKFDVFAYTKSPVFETTLLEGSVQVYDKLDKKKEVFLHPNERVTAVNGLLLKSEALQIDTTFLTKGIYTFEDKPFKEIMERLELRYDVKFNVKNKNIQNKTFTGKFRESDDVDKILYALQFTHPFKIKKIDEKTIEIY